MTSRRDFARELAASLAAAPLAGLAPPHARAARATGFLDVRRAPDLAIAQTADAFVSLVRRGDRWEASGTTVTTTETRAGLAVRVASRTPLQRLHLRWLGGLAATRLVLGDAWERGYGDLEWRGIVPDRAMPWYCALWDGHRTDGYGVLTSPGALCFWQADRDGLSLWADVRSGGAPVQLGERTLEAATVTCRRGREGASPFAAVAALCHELCPAPRLPAAPVYGHNDWYVAYGNNSAGSVRDDAARLADLAPAGDNRPFAVIDDGWQPGRGDPALPGRWDRGNARFPDLAALAAALSQAGTRPGIWIRPLEAPADAPDAWRLTRERTALDPTVPDVAHKIATDMGRLTRWGFQLLKHDYSTFDIFGRWGFQMGTALTRDGWQFREGPGRTTAEIVTDLYRTIRAAAGDALVLGCNTLSHLSAGIFEANRIGDDTSGTTWDRTRRMGVNSLAFRAPHHGAFYAADPDCVPVTAAVPWALTRQWLELVAGSGTMLFVSLAKDATGAAQRAAVRAALARAAQRQPVAEPLDWMATTAPARWRFGRRTAAFRWMPEAGVESP